MTSSGSLEEKFTLILDGIEYTVVSDSLPKGRVSFVATSDPAFVSSEGSQIGQRLEAILGGHGGVLQEESGWACLRFRGSSREAGHATIEGHRINAGTRAADVAGGSWAGGGVAAGLFDK